jgi:integrase/recombinase XerC
MSEISSFLRYLQTERRLSDHTVRNYARDLEQFEAFLVNAYDESRLSAAGTLHIRSWFAQMMEDGLSGRSLQRKRSTLSTFYRYARRQGWTQSDPVSKTAVPRIEKRLPSFVQQDAMRVLFEEVFGEREGFAEERDHLIFLLFYETGIRLSELIGLRLSDLNSTNGTLRVLGKRNKERLLPLREETVNVISTFMQLRQEKKGSGDGYLLCTDRGAKLYPSLVYRTVNSYLQRVTTLDKRSPHVIRHTFATHMLNNGAQLNTVKELLGHASLSATQVYTHNTIEKLKGIHERNHPKG